MILRTGREVGICPNDEPRSLCGDASTGNARAGAVTSLRLAPPTVGATLSPAVEAQME